MQVHVESARFYYATDLPAVAAQVPHFYLQVE
jgi:hypothetical protein